MFIELIRGIGFEEFFSLVAGFEGVIVGLDEDFPFERMIARPELLVVGVLVGPAEGFVAFDCGKEGVIVNRFASFSVEARRISRDDIQNVFEFFAGLVALAFEFAGKFTITCVG